ncbi:MAG: hypothetical protein ACHQT6_01750 [Candidatus Acidiferrales bacterium]
MRRIFLIVFLFAAASVCAQQNAPTASTPTRIDSPSEVDILRESCFTPKGIPGCAEELFTGVPVHIAVGSIAPQDGFGAGVAYVGHKTTENWRTTWNADAIGSSNASWRAGFYMNFVHTPNIPILVGHGTPPPAKANLTELPEHTVFGLYVQAISLNKLTYFGLGPATTEAGRSFYGMTQTILGGNAVKPFYSRLNASLHGEINGRFVNIRASNGQASPSIGLLYTEANAPGLTSQPGALQLGEGMQMRPVFAGDVVRLKYDLSYQQYLTPGNSNFSFQRLTIDLGHEFALYGKTTRMLGPRPGNGPDDCSLDLVAHPKCPKPYVRNFEGTVGFRFFTALSMTPGGDIVPFYFQPTIGGGDINNNISLSSYQDYRFRAPNVLLLRESFEHSIWNLPLGIALMADEGKVAMTRGDLSSSPWVHSFSAGLTLHAGGFPQVSLLFSWGGKEGTRTMANINPSLLGGSARPSLY